MTYQFIQLDVKATDNIACPHCGQDVVDWSDEQYIQPCEHVLFIAMDIGFEYMTDIFEQTMARGVDDLHANDDTVLMLEEIKAATYPEFIITASDLGIQGYSRYIGFAIV
ncbi:hypothetical protein B9T31_14455 [Acinetobacter sp. ANC 4558]|uniref:hypothetical protein n=1 Tax=Acinetobacter sp. ANC 4558 TaxID=1977876 RepID=UPI000A341233|nr:hypothetical protein [Acinetobacter sp. ANC 4558]OTG82496.1 hypothetical protein B9T31_14455 [Acinetobacter sp. ANC 4558]